MVQVEAQDAAAFAGDGIMDVIAQQGEGCVMTLLQGLDGWENGGASWTGIGAVKCVTAEMCCVQTKLVPMAVTSIWNWAGGNDIESA